jgi:hypothetical protein
MSRRKYGEDKFFTKISHTATSGVVGDAEYQTFGENTLRVVSDFTTSGTLTVQARIKHSSSWDNLGTLSSGGATDEFDIGSYDYVRFNFTVAAGSTGEIAASGFFKGSSASGGGAANSFTIMQTDAGTSPTADSATDTLTFTSGDASITITGDSSTDTIDLAANVTASNSFTTITTDAGTSPVADSDTDTLTLTSSDASITITGNSTTDTVDLVVAGGGDVTGPGSSVDNAIVRFDSTTGKIIQGYTSNAPTITDAGVPSFNDAAYAASERVGALSSVGSTSASAFGKGATANGNSSVSLGANSTATSYGSIALGGTALAYGNYSVSIGFSATTNNNADSIALGRNATCKQANSIVIGSYAGPVKHMFLGEGESTNLGAYADVSIQPTNPITVTNTTGADFLLKGSGSTGNVAGGSIKIQTQVATGASGTGTNATWEDMIEANGSKEVILNAEDAATADASLWTNSISFYLDETGNTLVVKAKYGAGTVKTGTVALT